MREAVVGTQRAMEADDRLHRVRAVAAGNRLLRFGGRRLSRRVRFVRSAYGIPGNWQALQTVRREVGSLWRKRLRKRSQRHNLPWRRSTTCVRRWIPSCKVVHRCPNQRFAF